MYLKQKSDISADKLKLVIVNFMLVEFSLNFDLDLKFMSFEAGDDKCKKNENCICWYNNDKWSVLLERS